MTTTATTTNNLTTPTAPVSFKVDTQPTVQEPTQPTEPVKQPEPPTPAIPAFKTFQTQEDFDNETAKIRGSAERKAKGELLKQLGIEDESKLEAIKQAYEKSKTDEERRNEQLQQLDGLKAQIVEKDAIIVALTKLSGKETNEVTKLVKMAKGLVSDDCTIEQALDEVMKMAQVQKQSTIPVSQQVNQGNTLPTTIENPFKDRDAIDAQCKLIKENPEQARQLAKAANFPITW